MPKYIPELCDNCKVNEKKCRNYHECFLCMTPFCGSGYHYYNKNFCSSTCMTENRLAEEREKGNI